MGILFRRSVKILPGLKVNFGKKGTSISIGRKGAHVTYGKNRKTVSMGIPGTGVYYRKTVSTKKKQFMNSTYHSTQQPPTRTKIANQFWGSIFLFVGVIISLIAIMASLITIGRIIIGCIGVCFFIVSYVYFHAPSIDESDKT